MKIGNILRGFIQQSKAYYNGLKKKRDIRSTSIPPEQFYDKVHEEAAPLFILSTGRSGTMLLTNLFGLSDQASVFHEPYPELEHYSRVAYENQDKQDYVGFAVDAARYEAIRDEYLLGKTYIETNNRITFFAPALAELFPNAKFIHIVRHPHSFVRSGLGRDWYQGNFHDEGRINPVFGDHKNNWESYSQEQKIAWLWNETNQFIESFKSEYPDRVASVTLEELVKNRDKVAELFEFAELDKPERSDIDRVFKKKPNKGKAIPELKDIRSIDALTPLKKTYY